MKLLSVVVPCYNSEAYMKNCINSLLVDERVEVVIIDDGSKDATGAIADDYAGRYPDSVVVVHQENGGHGEGINVGLTRATGKFFKVVDSDDWLSADLPAFLDKLEGDASDADVVFTNYVYTYSDQKKNNPIKFGNVFIKDALHTWNDTRKFKLKQFLMIHTCTFRTELAKRYGGGLPKKVFYEDNLFVIKILQHTEKIFYADLDLYHYYIGREGQSTSAEVFTKKYRHQVLISKLIFEACDLSAIREKSYRLFKIIYQETFILFGAACVYALRANDDDSIKNIEDMWADAYRHDEKYAEKMRKSFLMRLINVKGKWGRKFALAIYDLAHKIVQFN